jgi:hypothetical protein
VNRRLAIAIALSLSTPASADEAPRFVVPVDCAMGVECFVQNYVDQDPGPAAADFACGSLTYDGHDGSDIRVRDLAAMEAGVAVLAAAGGVVLRTRDGMADASVAETGEDAVAGHEAGNGVLIDHGGGWETQYSHLRQGSVRVAPGQRVTAGEPIGRVGLSGLTEFPHVHFEVRHGGAAVDPFENLAPGSGCAATGLGLWTPEAETALVYRAGGLLRAGFATEKPDAEAARRGVYAGVTPMTDAAAIVFWVDVFGTRAGDAETIRLIGPNGVVVAVHIGVVLPEPTNVHDRDRAQWFRFVGLARPDAGWAPGRYRGVYVLERPTADGVTLRPVETESTIEVTAVQ